MRATLLAVFLLIVLGFPAARFEFGGPPAASADSDGIVVTSAGAAGATGGAECPHDDLCTLRRALEVANADAQPGTFTITFAAAAFPVASPATITIGGAALPNVSRSGVMIDARGAGVVIAGASASLTSTLNGLTVTGSDFTLRGVRVHSFTGACVAVTGTGATIGGPVDGDGNVFGGCKSGVAVSGANATIQGNLVGFTPAGAADQVETAIVITGGGALVGGPASEAQAGNLIGFADTGVYVGSGAGAAFSGVRLERNAIGKRPSGEPASVGTGVTLAQPSNGTVLAENTIANVTTAVAVRPDQGGMAVTRNRFTGNIFENVSGLAIDLGEDGARNANDPGDEDSGPNKLLNHPVITRATQTRLVGTACAGCEVQVYLAAHAPGGMLDHGRTPLPGGVVFADGTGSFAIDNPPVASGEWLVALATDADGNTSEFGPPARVGAGAVLCGNVQLQPGWNHVAYFGAEPVTLTNTFTPGGSAISAIYRYSDGTGQWLRWLAETAAGRTLNTVQPGESYWFLATAPVTLPGGFSISFPVPVELVAGPNDFVYLGASAHPLDALSSLGGTFRDLYRFDAAAGTWQRYGDPNVPAWAQDFALLEACGVYQLRLDAPATLVPLQP